MKKILLPLLFIPALIWGQNTIGGVKASVPEAEVKRQSQFLVAERERLLGHFDKALELYKKFTYDHPENDAGWYGLSRTHTSLKDLSNALQCIGKAVAIAPDNQWYSIYQADLYEKLGRISEAVAVYEGLVKRFPDTPEFYEQLAYLCLQNEDPKKALKALDKWEALVGVNEDIAFKKHIVFVGLGDNKKAAAEYKKLIDTYPGEIKYRHRLADFYKQTGDTDNARMTYEEILRRRPDDPAARMALAGAGNKSDVSKLVALRPLFEDRNVPIDEKVKAIMPYFQKIQQGSDQELTKILLELGVLVETNHPDDAKAWSLSGDLFYHANRPDEALERYRRCINLNPTVFAVWDNTLTLLAARKNFDEMLRTAERAMDAFPNQPKAYYYYGVAANIKARPDDALPALEQGLLMTANNPGLRLDLTDQVGLALLGKKEVAGAIARYEQSLARGGDQHPGILEHLGDAYAISGQGAKAVECWKKANAIRSSPVLEQKISSGKM
ncbi:MAG: tetratricopeptide repeat protein [Saprospiraceae bacterium]|nr:tetratricopeptide repeat protein [Saprospiraceae bacterium]